MQTIQKIANSIARRNGYGKATKIIFDPAVTAPCVVHRLDPGYRKYTTGQYVPKKYLSNFGWKNTFYQHAETTIAFPIKTNLQ